MHRKKSWTTRIISWSWFILPLLICLALMLPRLASPQFNFEDDSISLQNAANVLAGKVDFSLLDPTNRFHPLYWLGFVLLYLLGGTHAFWFFLLNTLLLIASTRGMMYLVRSNGGTKLQASLTGALFALSGPVIETYYTVSKPEHVQLFWLLLSLILMQTAARRKMVSRWFFLLLTSGALFCTFLVKETTLVILPITAGWLALAAGGTLVYVAAAEVVHVHNESMGDVYKRYQREAMAIKRIYSEAHYSLYDYGRNVLASISFDLIHAARARRFWRCFLSILWY